MTIALTLNAPTDSDLMQAYCRGDIEAFNQLYQHHKTELYRYVLNSCNNEATAAELYQDIWAKVINARSSFRKDQPFNAWLYKIARNTIIDNYRRTVKQQHNEHFDENTVLGNAVDLQKPLQPDEMSALEQQSQTLQSALSELPNKQRDALLMRHVAGMTLNEIAVSTKENAETVKSRLRYATQKLRQLLREAL